MHIAKPIWSEIWLFNLHKHKFDIIVKTFKPGISIHADRICVHLLDRRLLDKSHNASDTSHYTPFCNRNVHICVHFCYKMVHCGIWDWCIVGFLLSLLVPDMSLHTQKLTWCLTQRKMLVSNNDLIWTCLHHKLYQLCHSQLFSNAWNGMFKRNKWNKKKKRKETNVHR